MPRNPLFSAFYVMLFCCGVTGLSAVAGVSDVRASEPESETLVSKGNPIIGDGSNYTADPAPLVVGDRLFILTGHDIAGPGDVDFSMPNWQMLELVDPGSGKWTNYPDLLRPEQVFSWAEAGGAFAAQIVHAPHDGRYYLYAPVREADSNNDNPFAIGVAVSVSPLGPWVDAHPAGPIVSQSYPEKNTIVNIDPTVLVDDGGRVYMYWGTFGKLKGVELEPDMVSFRGKPFDVTSLNGFFEAPWLFKRKNTYYMVYAANTAGPQSYCTEAIYYACLAYGTADSPLGPWTYRGVMLDPLSSTTSHPGIVKHGDDWIIAYHTADAVGGGHFRRSVAVDKISWDDSVSPPAIRKLAPTKAQTNASKPIANIASHASVFASNEPVRVQYWLRAVNDGKVREAPLPPDMWATWTKGKNPSKSWLLYQWDDAVTLKGSALQFWGDQPLGSGKGVAPPESWKLEYWSGTDWVSVATLGSYHNEVDVLNKVTFKPITTSCLRVVFNASTNGASHAGIGVQEWEVYAETARMPKPHPIKDEESRDRRLRCL